MNINVLKSDKNFVEFEFESEKHSLPNLLKEKLLEDKSVEYVSCMLEHPMDKGAKFVLRTKSGSPKKALDSALKSIDSDLDEFATKVKKALK